MGHSQKDLGHSREDMEPLMILSGVPKRFPSKLQLSSCAPAALLTTSRAPGPPVPLSDWSQCFSSREFQGVSSGNEVPW